MTFVNFSVLIESDWNLKQFPNLYNEDIHNVLIESDWNLKVNANLNGIQLSKY